MTDLHARLIAAVTKLKEIAEAAPAGPWQVEPHYNLVRGCRCGSCYEDKFSGFEIIELSGPPEHGPFIIFEDKAAVDHISANDPTVVLRRCKRDLEILDRHARDEHPYEDNCFWCSEDAGEFVINIKYPCPEIRLMMEEYQVEADSDDTPNLIDRGSKS